VSEAEWNDPWGARLASQAIPSWKTLPAWGPPPAGSPIPMRLERRLGG
jgi:hypothetical protein